MGQHSRPRQLTRNPGGHVPFTPKQWLPREQESWKPGLSGRGEGCGGTLSARTSSQKRGSLTS